MKRSKFVTAAVAAAAIAATGSQARATFIVTMTQVGSDVIANGSGTIDLTGLTFFHNSVDYPTFNPLLGYANFGPSAADTMYVGVLSSPDLGFLTGGNITFGSGNFVGAETIGYIRVPQGYVSGAALSNTDTFAGQTLSSMIDPGTYTWTWGSGEHADSFILEAGVPEPTSLCLLGLGAIGLLARRRRTA